MGLSALELEIIVPLCKEFGRPFTVLSLGHPDILATPRQLLACIGKEIGIDNEGVAKSRRYHVKDGIVGNARLVFDSIGGTLTVIDVRDLYGVDYIVDLNYPKVLDRYDFVIDPGTTEHCFNVGTAIKNAARAVRIGGYIYHMVPLCHWNHGFWNFSPGAFADFYEDNGFEILRLEAEYRGNLMPVRKFEKFEIPNNGRRLNLMCLAKRQQEVGALKFPMQHKYRNKT